MPIPLGPLEPLLAANVEKEVRKDAFAIQHPADLPALLARAREIDREFVARLERLPLVRLRIRYGEVEPIRRQRLAQLLDVAGKLLASPWQGLRPAVRARYGRAEFEAILREHLQLYAREVHALGRSVRLSVLLTPLRERLLAAMEAQANALAREVTWLLYGW